MHNDPIAFFITWTCYGTWLPGDERGWTKWKKGDKVPQPLLCDWCKDRSIEKPVYLNSDQRSLVSEVILEHCTFKNWHLHAVNCRTNHCHVVVTATNYSGEQVRDQLKSWGTRRLKALQSEKEVDGLMRERWWTRKGSVRYLFDEVSLDAAIQYTQVAQDIGGSKFGQQ